LASTDWLSASEQTRHLPNWKLHLFMLVTSVSLGMMSMGFPPALLALACVLILPGALFHDRKQYVRRDAALTLPWAVLMVGLIPAVVIRVEAMRFRFQDARLIEIDQALGFNVPSIMAWFAAHTSIGQILRYAYWSLDLLLLAAVLIPALAGRRREAETLMIANLFAFLVSLPIFMLLPAIGPWAGFHFEGTEAQRRVEMEMIGLQTASICLPSFHTIWAIFGAWTLRFLKPIRIPLMLWAALIVISTVSTGWHYVIDTLAGVLLAGASIVCAETTWKAIQK